MTIADPQWQEGEVKWKKVTCYRCGIDCTGWRNSIWKRGVICEECADRTLDRLHRLREMGKSRMTKERPTREDGRSATPRRMFRAGDDAVLLSYVPADDSRDVTVLTDVWTRDGGYADNGCCDVRFRDGSVQRVYSGNLVYPSPVCAESAQGVPSRGGEGKEKKVAVVNVGDVEPIGVGAVHHINLTPGDVVLFEDGGTPCTAFQVTERKSLRRVDAKSIAEYAEGIECEKWLGYR